MKRIVFFSMFLGFIMSVHVYNAQVTSFPYQFSAFNEPYLPLQNPVSLDQGLVWDDPEYFISLPFEWVIFEDTITDFILGGPGSQLVQDYYLNDTVDAVIPYFADIINVNDSIVVSPIAYEIVGDAPNRIFKIQWSNVGFYDEWMNTGLAGNTLSFQFWIYETTQEMRIHFGPTFIKSANQFQTFGFPCVMLIDEFVMNSETWSGMWTLAGPADNPQVVSVSAFGPFGLDPSQLLTSDPQEGQVYSFQLPTPIGVSEHSLKDRFQLFPQPAKDQVSFWTEYIDRIAVLNAQGQVVIQYTASIGLNTLDISSLSDGLYYLQSTKDEMLPTKLLVQH